jgi:Flp pilus assembly CpaE family ATPase
MRREVEATGLPLLATIPLDPAIAAMDADGMSVRAVPHDAPARRALTGLLERLYGRASHSR